MPPPFFLLSLTEGRSLGTMPSPMDGLDLGVLIFVWSGAKILKTKQYITNIRFVAKI